MHPLISIVLATYNEQENIVDMIHEISRYITPPLEIIVVDDDSPDGTWQIAQQLNDPRVRIIRRSNEKGLASAFYRGIQESKGEIVGWMDADLSMPPSLLPEMIDRLTSTDIAVGSRYVPGGKDERGFLRVFTSECINRLARIVLNLKVRDTDSGFVIVRREVIEKVPIVAQGHGEYFIEFLYVAQKRGFKIAEVPYIFRDRLRGTSKSARNLVHFLITGARYIIRIFKARFRNA